MQLNNVAEANSIAVVEKDKCYGCTACCSICPANAIEWAQDDEGFSAPVVDESACVGCGRCLQVCPVMHPPLLTSADNLFGYICQSSNAADLRESSSGGIFSDIARHYLSIGGMVCGCAWNEAWEAHHLLIESSSDLSALQKSKYVQSDLGQVFSLIRDQLSQNRPILFSGTPCQVAGLSLFLKASSCSTASLLTISVICHGVPSQRLFSAYRLWLEQKYDSNITELVFRDKSCYGWGHNLLSKFNSGEYRAVPYTIDPFYNLYIKGLINRKSCYTCPYSNGTSAGDLILGDAWKLRALRGCKNPGLGLSVVIPRTNFGVNIFSKIKDGLSYCGEGCCTDSLLLASESNAVMRQKRRLRDELYNKFLASDNNEFFNGIDTKPSLFECVKNRIPPSIRLNIKRAIQIMKRV